MTKQAREYTVYSNVSTEHYEQRHTVLTVGSKTGMMNRIRKDKDSKVPNVEHTSIWLKVGLVVLVGLCLVGMHMDSVELAIGALK
jgi:hypothetical protein